MNGLIKKFSSIYKFYDGGLNKFVSLLIKDVCPYEYMNSWGRFDETSLPVKEDFYSKLHKECSSNKDYAHAQKVWEVFEITNLCRYHGLYVHCDKLLLADVFENFRDKCIEIYELDLAHFVSSPGLVWQACLKKTGVRLELLTNIDMLLMVEEEIRCGICKAVYKYAKANNKYMNDCDKKKNSIISHVFRRKQLAWMGNVSKITCMPF